MFLVERLAGIQQAIDPGEQFLCRVIGVQDDAGAVQSRHLMHVVRARHGPGNGRTLILISQPFAGKKGGSAVRELKDNRRVDLSTRLQNGVDGVGADYIHSRQGKLIRFGKSEHRLHVVPGHDAGGNPIS
jgi:hypothetical protein